jgi:hypothetical protein
LHNYSLYFSSDFMVSYIIAGIAAGVVFMALSIKRKNNLPGGIFNHILSSVSDVLKLEYSSLSSALKGRYKGFPLTISGHDESLRLITISVGHNLNGVGVFSIIYPGVDREANKKGISENYYFNRLGELQSGGETCEEDFLSAVGLCGSERSMETLYFLKEKALNPFRRNPIDEVMINIRGRIGNRNQGALTVAEDREGELSMAQRKDGQLSMEEEG